MAIAFDAKSTGNASAPTTTVSHTCTGSNLILITAITTYGGASDTITGVTYNSVAMTRINTDNNGGTGPRTYLYYLINPSTGANNIVASNSASTLTVVNSASYTGAKQSSQPDSSNQGAVSATTTHTESTTTVLDNCWLVGAFNVNNGTAVTAGANTTIRQADGQDALIDSNSAQTPAGSKSMTVTWTSSQRSSMSIASIAPAVDAAAKNLTLLGVG